MTDQKNNDSPAAPEGSTERSGVRPSAAVQHDPEVLERPKRRRFSAEYKSRILAEADTCSAPGEIGSLLRREGLYSSHLAGWRKQLSEDGTKGLRGKKRGPAPKPKASVREIQLERENRALAKRLAKAEAIIEFQKKVHDLLGIPLKNLAPDEKDR